MGEGPLGGRGSSHVLISTSTLSRNCPKEETIKLSEDKHLLMSSERKELLKSDYFSIQTLRREKFHVEETFRSPYQTNGARFQLRPLYLKTENSDISRHKHRHGFLQFLHNKSKINFNHQLIIAV